MELQSPPFIVSATAINLIAEISSQIERFAMRLEQADALRLRKINRVKTIHGSLTIEGNELSEDEVLDIIDGKNVIAPNQQIIEVKNAVKTYEMYEKLNPFNEKHLLKAHGIMMNDLISEAGKYRTSNVGVFGEQGCVHLAPPANRVPILMNNLFNWLKHAKDHLLIRSCVFHYEFEFIHPFTDGNGRMGRLWQSLILGRLNPVFEHLPVENMVYANQQKYYDAITASTNAGQSGPFIDFMLGEILATLKLHQGKEWYEHVGTNVGTNVGINIGTTERKIINMLKQNPTMTANELSNNICITKRQCERLLAHLKTNGIIKRVGPNKGGRWEIIRYNPTFTP